MRRPRGRASRLLAWLAGALFAGASAAVPEASFVVPRDELLAKIRIIGVMPVEADDSVPNVDEFAARVEEGISARLREGGFTVVPAGELRAIRARGAAALGGLYDPLTGAVIAERAAALEEFTQHEYQIRHPVDATLHVAVVRRRAELSRGAANWDGVRERVSSESGVTGALQAMMSGMGIAASEVALSRSAKLLDARGEVLYRGFGGLLTLEYPTLAGTLAPYDLRTVDPRFALGDSALTARAVGLALDPLVTGAQSDKPVAFTLPPPPKEAKAPPPTLKELLRSHPRLVLAALELPPPTLEQSQRVQVRYRELLRAKFAALGFEIVGGADYDELWAAERAGSGGFYDRFSGHPDMPRVKAARARVMAVLRERDNATAVIVPKIVVRKAHFTEGYARWDGVSESVTGGGSALFNKSIFNRDLGYSGELDALSLKVGILDDSGAVLYEGVGGVQLIRHLDRGRIVLVPDAAMFSPPGNDALAVNVGMQALTQPPPQSH